MWVRKLTNRQPVVRQIYLPSLCMASVAKAQRNQQNTHFNTSCYLTLLSFTCVFPLEIIRYNSLCLPGTRWLSGQLLKHDLPFRGRVLRGLDTIGMYKEVDARIHTRKTSPQHRWPANLVQVEHRIIEQTHMSYVQTSVFNPYRCRNL